MDFADLVRSLICQAVIMVLIAIPVAWFAYVADTQERWQRNQVCRADGGTVIRSNSPIFFDQCKRVTQRETR